MDWVSSERNALGTEELDFLYRFTYITEKLKYFKMIIKDSWMSTEN